MAIVKDLGMVTAYAYAVAGGYEGTEAEFEQMLGQAGITLEQLENLTAVATTLSEGSEATASYSDGVLTFGIPRGNTGATGPQGPQGVQGDTGNGIVSITKTGTSGLVDTYTITFTDGTTTTFTVTNGADGDITNVAQAFDATKAYSVGDMVLYQGTLYAFTAAHAAGAWTGSDAQAVILADEVTELKDDLTDYTFTDKIDIYRCYFIRKQGLTESGAATDNIARASSIHTFNMPYPVKLVSDDPNIKFILLTDNGWMFNGEYQSIAYLPSMTAKIVLQTVNGAEITGVDIDKFSIYTTSAGKEHFNTQYIKDIRGTMRMPEYSIDNGVVRYLMDTTDGNLGTLLRRNESKRVTCVPFICKDSPCTIVCGQYDNNEIKIVVNGAIVSTITNGEWYTVEKNTPFIMAFSNSNTGATNKYESTNFIVAENLDVSAEFTTISVQTISNATNNGNVDTSFVANGKVFTIGKNTTGYSVKSGNTWLVTNQTYEEGVDVGHANSCNYDVSTGKVYVSDWYDPKIYVFDVDTAENTLTYDKTITVPLAEGRGSIEYFVFDGEKQMYFLGWKTLRSDTNPNVLVYGLYVLTTTGYELAWERFAVRPQIIQSFTVQGNYIYFVECASANYHTINVNRINMITGEVEYNTAELIGGITSSEAEGISTIGKDTFIVSDNNGKTYLVCFIH